MRSPSDQPYVFARPSPTMQPVRSSRKALLLLRRQNAPRDTCAGSSRDRWRTARRSSWDPCRCRRTSWPTSTSCTPGVDRIVSTWLVGIGKISDVDADRHDARRRARRRRTASKPSSTARSDANRNTAIATLSIVSAVRRLLRLRALQHETDEFHDVPPTSSRLAGICSMSIASCRSTSVPFPGAGCASRARRRAGRASPSRSSS